MLGALNMLGLAKRTRSRLLLTSTSEIYGDPEVHPQRESYWGHVNCIGPRACYDEGKRISETLCYEYHKLGVSVRIARIFNTFGPRMDPDDGRVVSNFIKQALRGDSLTLYGDGSQTRSFQYVSDLLQGLLALMNCDEIDSITGPEDVLPINLGNPDEYRVDDVSGGLGLALAGAAGAAADDGDDWLTKMSVAGCKARLGDSEHSPRASVCWRAEHAVPAAGLPAHCLPPALSGRLPTRPAACPVSRPRAVRGEDPRPYQPRGHHHQAARDQGRPQAAQA
jgi:nucleoside-diphosphate-sugar epimerase